MQYILTGFTHDTGCRVFAFEAVGKDRVRGQYSVRADLALIRKYGIPVQELPLLCRGVLERRDEQGDQQAFIYSETDMRRRADDRAAVQAAAASRKAPRKPFVKDTSTTTWRSSLRPAESRPPGSTAI